jgi:hypothetical protein
MRSIIPLFTLAAAAAAAAAPALAAEAVPVPAFRSMELRGGGEVTLRPGPAQRVTLVEGSSAFTKFRVDRNGRLRIDACNRQCPRRYRLRIEIQSPRVPDVGVMGGGAIRAATGFAPQSSVSAAVNGGGSIDLRAVSAVRVSAAVNGGGQISVRPRTHLSAAVNGGGEVRYWGNPQVSMAVHGGGLVRRAD